MIYNGGGNAASQRTCVVDANGGRSTTIFDSRGLTKAEQDPLGAYTSFSHDAVGNTVLRVDARNWATTFTMDALNRTAGIAYMDGTRATNYQYNAANAQVLITPPTGAPTTLTFDPVGNLTIQNTGGGADSEVVAASCSSNHANPGMIWSPENRLLSISNPDGSGEQSTYSADGLRKSRTSGGVTELDVVAASCSLNHANPGMIWDQQNLLIETDTSNVVQARYTDFPRELLCASPYCALILASYSTASSLLASGAAEDLAAQYGLWLLTAIRPNGYIWGGLTSQNRSGTSTFYGYDSQGSVRILANSAGG